MLVSSRRFLCVFLLLLSGVSSAEAGPGEILAVYPAPGGAPRDLAFQDASLWLLDDEARTLYQLDPATGHVLSERPLTAADPQGITWAAGRLWVTDAADGMIRRLTSDGNTFDTEVPAPGIGEMGASFRPGGLASDGATLWSGAIAGWSSRMNQLDPATGEVQRFYFSKGFPEAVEIAGTRLWSATHNGGHRAGLIYEYDARTGLHVGQFDAPGDDPVGLAYDGTALWCVDRESRTLYRLALN